MIHCLVLLFAKIQAADLLTYIAIILAFMGYVKLELDKLNGWKALLHSFKDELEVHAHWISSEYSNDYFDPNSYVAGKVVHPLAFDSLSEIIRRGMADLPIFSKGFTHKIVLLNERIAAFNSLLRTIQLSATTDVQSAIKGARALQNYKDDEGEFKKMLSKLPERTKYFAMNLFLYHKMLHVNLIGNNSSEYSLYSLSTSIYKEVFERLDGFERFMPWYIRYKWQIIILSVPLFGLIEYYL